MSARADLCGGRSVMIVPTATSSTPGYYRYADLKSLYPKRPDLRECNYALLRRGRSRYSTKTCEYQFRYR
jgi:hypothetical protein